MNNNLIAPRVWKDIPGYEGLYKASNTGLIQAVKRSGSKGGILKPSIYKGYKHVFLSKNNIRKPFSVHILVCMSFLPNKKNQMVVNHKDGKKTNNHIDNLEWCTKECNSLHAREVLGKNSIGQNNGNSKLTTREVKFLRWLKYKYSQIKACEIAEFYKMSDANICDIWNGKKWKNV